MILANNHLAYYEDEVLEGAQSGVIARMKVPLNSDTRVENVDAEGDPFGFVIHPGHGNPPWEIRCESIEAKNMWLEKLEKSINILTYRTNFEVGRVLGKGASGTVAEMKDKRNGLTFALKTMSIQNARDRKIAVAEAQLMQKITSELNHPNLIQIYHVEEEGDKFYLVMELCRGGELYEYIANAGHFSERNASKYLHKIMSGLEALHSHNILHLDIKPENLLLSSKDESRAELKITDFGLAKVGDSRTRMGDGVFGTIGYMAPELITSRMCAPSCDIWAAGVILYIMLVGYPPFWGDSNRDILEKTAQGKYHMFEDDWKEISDDARSLVKWMLTLEAAKRPTASEVLNHPWVKQLQGDVGYTTPANEVGTEQKPSESTMESSSDGEKANLKKKHPQFDRDLTNTRIRMDRYNTQRRTATASVAMTQVLDGIGTNPLFPFQPTTDGNEYFTKERVEVIRRVWASISPDSCLHYQQFKVLTMHINILLPRSALRLLFQFRDVDQDGRISVDDYVTSSKMVDEGHERFLRLAFIIFSGIKIETGDNKTWADSLREASFLIPTRNEEFLHRRQIEKLYSTYCEERLEESNLKKSIARLFAVDHEQAMLTSPVGMKCASSEDLFALSQQKQEMPELLDKITYEMFKKRAPSSPDILEIFTSHRRSDKKMHRLYGGSSSQEIDEVRDNTMRRSSSDFDFVQSQMPHRTLGREESADSRNSSRPSENSASDDVDDLVSNHEMFFKLAGLGDIVTMSAMLEDDVEYHSFTRNQTIIGRPSTINVFSIVRITSGARKMVGEVCRINSTTTRLVCTSNLGGLTDYIEGEEVVWGLDGRIKKIVRSYLSPSNSDIHRFLSNKPPVHANYWKMLLYHWKMIIISWWLRCTMIPMGQLADKHGYGHLFYGAAETRYKKAFNWMVFSVVVQILAGLCYLYSGYPVVKSQ